MNELIKKQDEYFKSEATRSYEFRMDQLQRLKNAIYRHEKAIIEALHRDLRKNETESFLSEVGFIYTEISDCMKHLKKWMKPLKVPTPLVAKPAYSRILSEPLGRSLLISPWNYPFQLCIAPLIGAIAAGNVAIIKPSELAPNTASILEVIINESFAPEYLRVVTGGVALSQELLQLRWDHIFFTGSTNVGKLVAAAAAKHLTPCILELGGKSPCIVTKHAQLKVTASRIVFGKFLNSGQTCVAPDYILVEESIKDALIEALKSEIVRRFGHNPLDNLQLPKIINAANFDRLIHLIDPNKIAFGGRTDAKQLLIEPTLMVDVKLEDPIMKNEIFGPLLPILAYNKLEDVKATILSYEKPLALYIFSEDKTEQNNITQSLSFGGGCINDTLMHLSNPNLPFGGVGASGSGGYHGKHSFDAFSHKKALLSNTTLLDLPLRYAPWTKAKEKVFRLLMR
ncbi:MAG: aldehyde dehydrogenase [Proteobacteria bacterium]|nr:aldehyde dehydrogenase [Pseudomonadota bacterium]